MTDKELYIYIGQLIRTRRKQLNLSQLELAQALGKSRAGYISDYETAKIPVPIDVLYKIAAKLDTSVYNLLPG